jgi:hypothetical protein
VMQIVMNLLLMILRLTLYELYGSSVKWPLLLVLDLTFDSRNQINAGECNVPVWG